MAQTQAPVSSAGTPSASAQRYVTQDQLTTELGQAENALRSLINQQMSEPNSPLASGGVFNSIAVAQRIDQLTNTKLLNVAVSGISGLTAADIPQDIVAANYLPLVGGTLTGGLSLPYLMISSTTATSIFSGAVAIGTTSSSQMLSVAGDSYFSGTSFFGGTITATSTATFNAGLAAFASTTIGNGTQISGLTISGGATTTGNAYVAGNVGIGTTSPFGALSVVGPTTNVLALNSTAPHGNTFTFTAGGTAAVSTNFPTIGNNELVLTGATSGNNILALRNTDPSGYSALTARDSSGSEKMAIGYGNSGVGAGIFANTDYIQAWGDTTPPMFEITQDGNYGTIGSGFRFYRRLSLDTSGNFDIWKLIPWGNTQDSSLNINAGTGVAKFVATTSSDAVVIRNELSTGFSTIAFQDSNANGRLYVGYANSAATHAAAGKSFIQTYNGGSIPQDLQLGTFTTSFTPTAVFTGGNLVGIGTTTPWRTLSVKGTVGFDGLTGAIGTGSLCLSANKEVVFNSGSDNCLSSLRSTKHDIQDLTVSGEDLVDALQPVSFIYNDDASSTVRYGFIAEDSAAVDQHLATYGATGAISGVDDRAMLAVVVAAVQGITHVTGAFESGLVAWFGNASNGIGDLFATNIHAQNELCIGATCLSESQLKILLQQAGNAGAAESSGNTATPATDSQPPIITLVGADPATLHVGDTYIDPGVTVSDVGSPNIGYVMSVDGGATTTPDQFHLDTSTSTTHIILYSATDQAGNSGRATRTVIIQ